MANYRLNPKEDYVMQWRTQVGSIITNLKVKIYLNLSELSATKIVTWNFHVDEPAKEIYDMILARYIWRTLGLNLKLFSHVIESKDEPFKGSMEPMVDMVTYWL